MGKIESEITSVSLHPMKINSFEDPVIITMKSKQVCIDYRLNLIVARCVCYYSLESILTFLVVQFHGNVTLNKTLMSHNIHFTQHSFHIHFTFISRSFHTCCVSLLTQEISFFLPLQNNDKLQANCVFWNVSG